MTNRQDGFFIARRREQRRLKALTATIGLVLGTALTVGLLAVVGPFVGIVPGGTRFTLLVSVSELAFVAFYALGYSLGSVRLNATLLSMLADLDPVEKQVFKAVLEKAIAEETQSDVARKRKEG